MYEIEMTDADAKVMIELLKSILQEHHIDLSPGNKGTIDLIGTIDEDKNANFKMDFFTPKNRDDKITVHLRVRESENYISLLRLNIDPTGFHKNANGNKIEGNRILIFSSGEWVRKREQGDNFTHVKAYALPSHFSDVTDLFQVFLDFLVYINVKEENKLTFRKASLF